MAYPLVDRSTRLSIVAEQNGMMIYGNRTAFRTLARWMTWLAKSDPREHFEVHIPWHLQSPSSRSKRVRAFKKNAGLVTTSDDVEVTFMVLNENELEALGKSEKVPTKVRSRVSTRSKRTPAK